MASRIRRNDQVEVISGSDRGVRGEVREVNISENRAIVTGVNIVKRHQRATGPQNPGGIIEREAPIDLSNLAVVSNACESGARVRFQLLEDGQKSRVCVKCAEVLD